MGLENLKMQSLFQCNKHTGRIGTANNLFSCREKSPKSGNLEIFEVVEDNGTVFAPKQCLHQKVDMGLENLKMQSLSRCNNALGVTARQINPVSCTEKRPKTLNLGVFKAVEDNGAVFAPRQCSHQKVAMGMENLKMQSFPPCNKRTGR